MDFHHVVATDIDYAAGKDMLVWPYRHFVFPDADVELVSKMINEYFIEKNGLREEHTSKRYARVDPEGYWDILCSVEKGPIKQDIAYMEGLKGKNAAVHAQQAALNDYKCHIQFKKRGRVPVNAEDEKRTQFMDGFSEFLFKNGVCVAEHLGCTYPKETRDLLNGLEQDYAEAEEG